MALKCIVETDSTLMWLSSSSTTFTPPVFVLFAPSISSAEQGAVDLTVLTVSQLVCHSGLPPSSEMVEMNDAASSGVKAWGPLLSQPHVVVPVYLHAM